MTAADAPLLRYLSAADVRAAMPSLEERLELAERTMTALATGAELPPKIGVHPRPTGSFAHAMPSFLAGTDGSGSGDLLGMKWVAGVPDNRARGLDAIHGLVLLNDPATGIPSAVLDAGPITAERTAAVSGVAIARFAPAPGTGHGPGGAARVALLGAGVQGHSHLEVLGRTLPGLELVVFDRHRDRAAALVGAAGGTPGLGSARAVGAAREATLDADVVVSAASFAPADQRQTLTDDWLTPDALVVAVDYATYVAASVARSATLFVVDHREQFLANRDAGNFDGYPDPGATIGEAVLGGTGRPAAGRILVTHLGVGLADVVFGDAIVRRAVAAGLGTLLPR